ncbi:ABC-2 type transport system ATP-binding protein [Hamadaea flava]|uniref:ATP-binding cassette domain-containing protein n=1 Tax=Hamadaea flava TaxID=1742688 RepID=A0ABV8LNX6_9ACTN|nr:ATP-binding cassette domain-containing protein [Hamadaea flava]MCP2321512.1 ABC-2 type transport system ATP-binding protein [Hamadaea flava]
MIEATGLRKSFRSGGDVVEAVQGLDLKVAGGEIFGLLGPNGAGKTTTLRMLTTLTKPDGGQATVAGADLIARPREVRRRIGFVAQGQWTWSTLTAREELIMQARLYGLRKSEAAVRAEQAIADFGMTAFADRICRTYSGGQRRRVDIALGIVHSPQVLFLDEPTSGLDPQSRAHLWDEVRRLRDAGTTIVLTTHYLEEADALCDRVAIVDHGRVVDLGSPRALKDGISGDVVTLGVSDPASALDLLSSDEGVRTAEIHGDVIRLVVGQGAQTAPLLLKRLYDAGVTLTSIEVHQPSLDDVFLARTGRSLRDRAE